MIYYWLSIISGFVLLVGGADRFVVGAAAIAKNMGVSTLFIGLAIVGFGTSLPEMLVSGTAAFQGNSGLAIGNAVGSNIMNIALILGITALIYPLDVHSKTLKREFPILLVVSVLAYVLVLDKELGRIDGMLLFFCLIIMIMWMFKIAKSHPTEDLFVGEIEDEIEMSSHLSMKKAALYFVVGLIVLIISSRMLVWGAVNIAYYFGVSDLIIGLTIVSFGTSLPELAASIMSAFKNEHDLAIGNIIGSNLYNLLAVLSLPGIINPGKIDEYVVYRDFPVMIILTIALLVMGYGFGNQGRVNRFEGLTLLFCFIGYQSLLYYSMTTGVI